MAEKGGVYVLDEPTTGLHLADVEQLLGLLDRLVDAGKSVIVIEHHQAVMAHADWIIDLGPGAGHDGGRIVFEGRVKDLKKFRPRPSSDSWALMLSCLQLAGEEQQAHRDQDHAGDRGDRPGSGRAASGTRSVMRVNATAVSRNGTARPSE